MKKIIFIFLFSLINVIFATEEKVYRYIKITNPVENKKKQKIAVGELYPDEFDATNYVYFLLSERKLNIDYSNHYSPLLIDEKDKWLVLLYLNKKDENGIIYDTIDYPLMYCFYLGKATGEISEFYMIEQLFAGNNPVRYIDPTGLAVDYAFIRNHEGAAVLNGYIPQKKDGTVIGKSGVTIASGFDLGQQNSYDLNRIFGSGDTNKTLKDLFTPYLGKQKEDAKTYLKDHPLSIME